jgi:hypothetical protein
MDVGHVRRWAALISVFLSISFQLPNIRSEVSTEEGEGRGRGE